MRREDRLLHRFPSLSQTSVEFGLKCASSAVLSADPVFSFGVLAPAQAGAHPRASILTFVRPRRRLAFAPTAGCRGRRAQMLSRLARGGPPVDDGLGLDSVEHDGTLVMSGPPYAGWDTGWDIVLTSKLRPWCSTLQAMRASLLASAIASTLWCSRLAAAAIQGLRP